MPAPSLSFDVATPADGSRLAALRNRASEQLTEEFGGGHWSNLCTEQGVVRGILDSRVVVARRRSQIVATLRLTTRKPWAIDRSYFSQASRPIYLVDMAVDPAHQRRGLGRALIEAAQEMVRHWPGDAIRLDAYDAPAGAGEFYRKCGFRERGRVTYRATPLIYFEWMLGEAGPRRPHA